MRPASREFCRHKTKPPVPDRYFRKPTAVFTANLSLGLDDPRSYEENQLLVRGADGGVLEQLAKPWNAAQQGNLVHVDRVVGLNNAADDHRAAIGDQHLGGRLLRDQSGVAVNRTAEVRRRVFHVHVQEDGTFRRDLRNYRQPQESIDVGYGWRPAQLGLGHDRHAHALSNQGLDVVLRYYPRTGQDFQQSARFSSMVRMASIRTEELAFKNEKPLVGLVAPKLENSGICVPVVGVGAVVPTIG